MWCKACACRALQRYSGFKMVYDYLLLSVARRRKKKTGIVRTFYKAERVWSIYYSATREFDIHLRSFEVTFYFISKKDINDDPTKYPLTMSQVFVCNCYISWLFPTIFSYTTVVIIVMESCGIVDHDGHVGGYWRSHKDTALNLYTKNVFQFIFWDDLLTVKVPCEISSFF